MSVISNYDKSVLCDKYKYLLKYYCYNNANKLCNKLSYKKNGYCDDCNNNNTNNTNNNDLFDDDKQLKNSNNHHEFIVLAIKNLLDDCNTLANKPIDENSKDYRLKKLINIFENQYYNFFFCIINPKFFISIIQKIFELNSEKDYIQKYIETHNYKRDIYKFFMSLYNFFTEYKKKNNIIFDMNIQQEDYDIFSDNFVEYIQNYYDKEINLVNIKDNKYLDIDKDIDINNISNIDIILTL